MSFSGEIVSVREIEPETAEGGGLRAWEVFWRVTDFLGLARSDLWVSPSFKWTGKDGLEAVNRFRLSVRPETGSARILKVMLHTSVSKCKFSVCLIGRDQIEYHSLTESEFSVGFRVLDLLPWSRLLEETGNLIAPDGSATFIIRFHEVVEDPIILSNLPMLGVRLGELYSSGDRSDLKILVSGKVFYVHRNILATRSPVFATMLLTDMTEANSGEIQIPDSSPPIVDAFLRYLYTGTTTSYTEFIPEILYLAEKYLVQDLKEVCAKILSNTLSVDNVVSYLKLSKRYLLSDLERQIIRFLKNHKQVMTPDMWRTLQATDATLINDILIALAFNTK